MEARTRQTGETWRDQWERLQRWHGRLNSLLERHVMADSSADWTYVLFAEYMADEVDVAYAFFMNCYHLKDWLKRSARAGKA